MTKPKVTTFRSSGKTKIDWVEARKFYMEDTTRSYQDVADKFGVAKKTVELRAKNEMTEKGSKTTWAIARQRLGEQATQAHEEELVDEKSKADDRHLLQYKNLQSLLNNKMVNIKDGVPYLDRSGKVILREDGKPLMKQVEAQELHYIARALQTAINGERVILGLPTTVTSLVGKDGNEMNWGWADAVKEAAKLVNNDGEPQ